MHSEVVGSIQGQYKGRMMICSSCPKQVQGFKPPAALLHPNTTPPPPLQLRYHGLAIFSLIKNK